MKSVAAIVLNRNLPEQTDRLVARLRSVDSDHVDVFVVDAGSETDRRSKFTTWSADSPDAKTKGLRYSRGMNFGLVNLVREGRFDRYEAFFFLTNDLEFEEGPIIAPLLGCLEEHPRVGILSPCSRNWGERLLIPDRGTKYFWFIHNTAFLVRRSFIEAVANLDTGTYMDLLFDGSNFRGYAMEMELIAKAYANDWSAAITTRVFVKKDESHLLTKADLIKTEPFEENLRLYIQEGKEWMRRKYGFNSRWSMQMYVKLFYDKFFQFHPEYAEYMI